MVKYFVFVTVTVVFLLLPHFFDYLAFVSFFFFFFFFAFALLVSRNKYFAWSGLFLDCKYEIYLQTKTPTEEKLSFVNKHLHYTYFYKNTTK